MYYGSKKVSQKRPKSKKVNAPESSLQSFTDEYLTIKHIKNIRLPDWLWSILQARIRYQLPQVYKWFTDNFAGFPDNFLYQKISDKYNLALSLELKTKSKLHGAQKNFARHHSTQIAKTPEQVQRTVDQYEKDAAMLNEILAEYSIAEIHKKLIQNG